MKTLTALSLIFALTSFTFAFAQDTSKETAIVQDIEKSYTPVKFIIAGALELGGDEIAEVYFTNGNTQSVKAGQGGSIAIGGQLQIPKAEKFLVRATVGIKYVTTEADNAHIRLTRIPIHVTGNWMATEKIRLSAGLATHQAIRFNSGGIGNNFNFKNATGPVFEIAYRGIGLSYTAMAYKDQSNVSYSANAVGVTFSVALPNN